MDKEMIVKISADITQMQASLKRIGQDFEQLGNKGGRPFENLTKNLESAGQRMSNVGKDLSMKLTAPLALAGTGMMKTYANFEDQMARVKAISGASEEEFQKLNNTAKELGASTRFSASEAGSALEFLSMAGFKANESMKALPGLLDLAAASGTDLGVTADITSNILSGFQLNADQAGRMADVLAKTTTSSNVNVEMLGNTMSYVAPVAADLGLSLEEVSAAAGLLGDAGIQSQKAGTSLRMGLLRLANATPKAAGTMEELGLEFFTSEGKMKSLAEIVETLQTKMADLTDEQRTQALATIFGAESVSSWSTLMARGSDELTAFTKELENSSGTAAEMAETMNDTTKGGFKEMMSALEGLAIAFGELLAPKIAQVADKITELMRNFTGLSEETKMTILKVGGFALALGPLAFAAGKVITAFAGIGKALGLLRLNPIIGLVTILGTTLGGIFAKNFFENSPLASAFGELQGQTNELQREFNDLEQSMDESILDMELTIKSGLKVETGDIENLNSQTSEYKKRLQEELQNQMKENTMYFETNFGGMEDANPVKEEQKAILDKRNSYLQEQFDEVDRLYKEYNKISSEALKDGKTIRLDGLEEIKKINEQMASIGQKSLSDLQVEGEALRVKSENAVGKEKQQYFSERIKLAYEKEKKAIEEADKQLKDQLKQLLIDKQNGAISTEEYDSTRQKIYEIYDDLVNTAKDTTRESVQALKDADPEIMKTIEVTTGKIKTDWDEMLDDMAKDTGSFAKKVGTTIFETGGWIGRKLDDLVDPLSKKLAEPFKLGAVDVSSVNKASGPRKQNSVNVKNDVAVYLDSEQISGRVESRINKDYIFNNPNLT
ncbi:phage tail tape measure protein [Rossellomorea vietnamensis]|uniref:Phage tail tape measure protein n=1 Tax=Rossellomorea vietnamensis TaxID=218284 RepID=A0A5D4M3U8_9BACI|nr:phage tail tape measure protein [Rossellomorea vietnamensis]TYR95725.1 phage tail tape measure protein [Rossellomorea vietnamensis]